MGGSFGIALILGLCLLSLPVQASQKGINFQAVIRQPDGTYPTASGLTVTLQILDPVNGCVLREEEHSQVNISNGYLNLVIGNPSAVLLLGRNPNPALSLSQIFDNSVQRTGLNCVNLANTITATNQSYTPAASHSRKLRVRLMLNSEEIVGDFNLRDVAFAANADALGGKGSGDFIQKNTAQGVTQTNLESVFARYSALDSILNGTYSGTATSANTCTTATNVSGTVAIANGGTGATTAAGARTNLGLGTLATMSPGGVASNTTYLRGDGVWASVSGGVTSVAGRTGAVTLTSADLTDFATAVDGRADTRADARIALQKGANNGLATLGAGGKVPSTQLALTASDLPTSGVGAGTYRSVTVDTYGRVTAGTNPTTLSGYGITDALVTNGGGVTSLQSGVEADRPGTSGPTTGRLYFATDTQKIYRDNGATWDLIASHTTGGSATTDAGDLIAGTLAAARLPAFTGDVTSNAGSNTLTLGTVPLTKGGTGLTAGGTSNQVLGMNAAGTAAEYKSITAGSGVTVTHSAGGIEIAATGGGGSGTVTSVDVAVPAYMSKSGGPVTTSGTITLGFGSQSAKQVFAAPSGASGAPGFRNLLISDVYSSIGGASFLNTTPACTAGRALTYVSATDQMECADLSVSESNLSGTIDVAKISGLGGAATLNVGTGAGTVSAGNDSRFPASTCASGNKMRWDGSAWQCETDATGGGSSPWTTAGNDISFSDGNVGIGAPSSGQKLEVTGNIKASGRISGGIATNANALTAITADFSNTNTIRSTAASGACGVLDITNTSPGGDYTITIRNATATCTTIQWNGATTNVKLPPAYSGGVSVAGLVYTFLDDGETLWVSYVGF